MTEFELIRIGEDANAQIVMLVGQIIAINSAMIVAIYYFLSRAGLGMKLSAFLVYTLGSVMFFLLAVRQSTIIVSARAELEKIPEDLRTDVTNGVFAFGDSSISFVLSAATNLSVWALWLGVIYLLFFWTPDPKD